MKKKSNPIKHLPLWLQTASIFSLVITLVIGILIINNYRYNRNSVINTHVSNTQTVLGLELDSLSQYIKDLTSFAIQPCYDTKLTRYIETKTALSDEDVDYIKSQMKEYYYSRTDLNSYYIYFMNHDTAVGRDRNAQHLSVSYSVHLTDELNSSFEKCCSSKYFLAIEPSEYSNDFFTFYHSIIQINNKSALAYVRCDIDKAFLSSMIESYGLDKGEIVVIYNTDGNIIYSGDTETLSEQVNLFEDLPENGYSEIELNNKKYMLTSCTDNIYGLSIVSLEPYSIITASIKNVLTDCLWQGIILWAAAVSLIYFLCHMVMTPLNNLAKRLKRVGEGDFETRIDITGSSEIENLGSSFNYMSEHIQSLINENYLVRLNEQSARLIALEAQINPHFLYNTLQAISTEALVNDQMQIHEMVISLAAILRYSIKGGDFVTLADEMEHVKKYIYIQKIRMDDNLNYSISISEESNTCIIPKISVQTLVENSIIHGMAGLTSISISIKAYVENETLFISVSDDGCGMDEKALSELRKKINDTGIDTTETHGIGLANLYTRLRILYDNKSSMTIESRAGCGTVINITIPVKRGSNE